jgi:hypothetical protein
MVRANPNIPYPWREKIQIYRIHGVSKSKYTVSMVRANPNIPYPWCGQIKIYCIHGVSKSKYAVSMA